MRTNSRRGAALISVLWLTAVLVAIAFSVSTTVRGEIDRATTLSEGIRCQFLARGAIERFLLDYRRLGRSIFTGGPARRYSFPEGEAVIELIPESSKLNVNTIEPEDLVKLLLALDLSPDRAQAVAAAIVDWRTALPPGQASPFDAAYLERGPTFLPRHASFQDGEELLLVQGVTRELYYGSLQRNGRGELTPRGGLKDCLSVYGTNSGLDAQTANPAVLFAVGLTEDGVSRILEMRRATPAFVPEQWTLMRESLGPMAGRVSLGGRSMFTLRATARLRAGAGLSDTRRSVAALIKFDPKPREPYHLLRWEDNVLADPSW
ncbi:MAG: general secretion pathway protein GspK [Bryobacteraceae bacterium]|nr:general secretion pathway protein GspK [Bryobacteraceae bacterium]